MEDRVTIQETMGAKVTTLEVMEVMEARDIIQEVMEDRVTIQIQAGVAETLPSRGIQFADDALPYLAGSDKGPYLRPQQEPKVIVVPGNEGSERGTSLPAQDGTYPYPGITYPYFRKAASPPFRAFPTVIYIF